MIMSSIAFSLFLLHYMSFFPGNRFRHFHGIVIEVVPIGFVNIPPY